MRRVPLDTNVILDVLVEREPFVVDAAAIWQAVQDQTIQGVDFVQSWSSIKLL